MKRKCSERIVTKNKKTKLDVPHIFQKKNSAECGLACVYMILKNFGVDIDIEQLRKEIKITDRGTYAPQLANYLVEHGFNVKIIGFNPWLFSNFDFNMPKYLLKKRFRDELSFLKKKKRKDKEKITCIEHYLKFLDNGGNIKIKIPKKEDIQKSINNGLPIISLMTSSFLFGDIDFNFHFNVVTGYNKNYLFVNDPLQEYEGCKDKKIPIDQFLFGIHSSCFNCYDNGSIIIAQPNKLI